MKWKRPVTSEDHPTHPSLPQFPRLICQFPRGCYPSKTSQGKKELKKRHGKKKWSLTASKEAKVWRISPTTLHQSAKFACLGWWVPTSFSQPETTKRKPGNPRFRWMRFPGSYIMTRRTGLTGLKFQSTFFLPWPQLKRVSWLKVFILKKSGSLAKGFRILGNVKCLGRL